MVAERPAVENQQSQEEQEAKASLWDLTKYQWTVFISLCLMNFSLFTLIPLIAPLFPTLADERGITPLEMGFVMGSSWLVMFATAPLFGLYINTIGARMLTLSGIATAGIGAIWFGTLQFVYNRWAFLAIALFIRCVEGLGVSAFIVAAQTIASGVMRAHIQMVMGIFLSIQGVAVILSPLIAGFLYHVGGFIVPFALMGTLAVLCAPINWYILRDFEGGPKVERGSMKPMFLNINVIALAVHVCVLTTTFKFIEYYSALYVKKEFQYGPTMIGVILSVACVSFALTAIMWAKLSKVIGGRIVICISAVLACASCCFLGPVPFLKIKSHNWLYFVMTSLFGAALSGGLVPVIPVLLKIARSLKLPDNFATYGVVSACYNSSYDIGCFLGPIIGGPLYNYAGFPWSAAVFALTLFLTASVILGQELYERRCCCSVEDDTRELIDDSPVADTVSYQVNKKSSRLASDSVQVTTVDETRPSNLTGSDGS